MPSESVHQESKCVHHWKIETPMPVALGEIVTEPRKLRAYCKKCFAQRTYVNDPDQWERTFNEVPLNRRGAETSTARQRKSAS